MLFCSSSSGNESLSTEINPFIHAETTGFTIKSRITTETAVNQLQADACALEIPAICIATQPLYPREY